MPDMVIAAYRPKPCCAEALAELAATHVPHLRRLGLATDRPALAMRAADGTILEVLEWRDGGIDAAHTNPEIHALWARYAELCDYTKLTDIPEASTLFATFTPIGTY